MALISILKQEKRSLWEYETVQRVVAGKDRGCGGLIVQLTGRGGALAPLLSSNQKRDIPMADFVIVNAERPNWYRFYPVPAPQGDFGGADHHRVWIAEQVRADYSDRIIAGMVGRAIVRWTGGEEQPIELLSCVSATIDDDARIYLDWTGEAAQIGQKT